MSNVVVFDLDGVIYRGDTFYQLVLHHLRKRPTRLLPMAWTAVATVHLLIHAETRGVGLQRLAKAAVGHLTLTHYQRTAREVGLRLAHEHGAVAEAMTEIRQHLRAGATVVVATASEFTLARAYLDGIGLGQVPLVGSHLAAPSAGFADHVRGLRKLVALEAVGFSAPFFSVYTDSASDLPLLLHTERPVLVNASTRTAEVVQRLVATTLRQVMW